MKSFELLLIVYIGLVGLVTLSESQSTTDYCSKALCGDAKHIACNNNGSFAKSCSDDKKLVNITAELKAAIVKRHNEHRNSLAGGKEKGLEQCPRMATMQWDDELAKMAEYNVKTCVYAHDACRNTNKFKLSGQNIARTTSNFPHAATDMQMIPPLIDAWWSEIKDATMKEINNYPASFKAVIGHFTVMAVEGNDRVGCAASTFNFKNPDKWYAFLFTCNYARTNILNYQTYSTGKAATKCKTGVNPAFKSLCSTKEVY